MICLYFKKDLNYWYEFVESDDVVFFELDMILMWKDLSFDMNFIYIIYVLD